MLWMDFEITLDSSFHKLENLNVKTMHQGLREDVQLRGLVKVLQGLFLWEAEIIDSTFIVYNLSASANSLTRIVGASLLRKWRSVCSDLEVDFESEESASIVYATLAVDKELQPDKVKRQMSVSNCKLSVHFEAVEARFLRASYSSLLDVLTLATKTIEEFGNGLEL